MQYRRPTPLLDREFDNADAYIARIVEGTLSASSRQMGRHI